MLASSLVALVLLAPPAAASGRVLAVAELNTEEIRALDRSRTAVILPGGILEEHGPYLPSFTDGFGNERLAADLAQAIAARPGWTALVFPTIPLGSGGANEIGRRYVFPGSYTVRSSIVRGIFMDLATELGEQGFRWVFVVHGHGSPHHNRALDDASDFFRDGYGGQMVHLLGLMDVSDCCAVGQLFLSPEAQKEDGFTVHAGAGEHSDLLFLRPDLVSDGLRQAPSITGASFADLVAAARQPGWPGYFGAPRHASAAQGAAAYEQDSAFAIAFALKVLDGFDPRGARRYSNVALGDAAVAKVVEEALAREAVLEARQRAWLAARALPDTAATRVELENEVVRVLHPRFGPGQTKPMHSHPARVIVWLTPMQAEQTLGDGRVAVGEAQAGDARFSPPTAHAVRNLASAPLELIEVELKPLAKPRAVVLPDRLGQDPAHFTPVLENDQVRVLRFRLGPRETGQRHAGTPHVSVFLTDAHLELTDASGRVRQAQVEAGTVAWSEAEAHTPRNLRDQPVELLSVEPKAAPE